MVNGRFYFTQTQNGNLLGEYSNSGINRNLTESADLKSSPEIGNFIGVYNTTWFDGKAQTLILTISEKNGNNRQIFVLQWANRQGEIKFFGEALVSQNVMIGNYWDDEVEGLLRPELKP